MGKPKREQRGMEEILEAGVTERFFKLPPDAKHSAGKLRGHHAGETPDDAKAYRFELREIKDRRKKPLRRSQKGGWGTSYL